MRKPTMTKQKFCNQWLRHFAPGLSKKDYEDHIKDQYIWHVFSWELMETPGLLVSDAARAAFDGADHSDCICCDLFGGGGVKMKLPALYDTAEKIDENLQVFYVVAADYSWTYIKTHEPNCGPYFLRLR